MKKSNRYASFLLRLWQPGPTDDEGVESWQGEIEHIQSGKVLNFMQLRSLPHLLCQIANEDRYQKTEDFKNE